MLTVNQLPNIKSIKVRDFIPNSEDELLEKYSYSMLSAINTCPTWGIVRYGMRKRMSAERRSLALEAGSACHRFFAAVRMLDLLKKQKLEQHFLANGARIFGEIEFQNMCAFLEAGEDDRTRELNFALEALYNSGFYDDPDDKRRTMTNLEESCIFYFDRWPSLGGLQPIWVESDADPLSRVGIEIYFKVVIEFALDNGDTYAVAYSGLLDGLHRSSKGKLVAQENKTASRLGEAWGTAFQMSHQITGYCIAGTTFAKEACYDAIAIGSCIPLPTRAASYGGTQSEHVLRDEGRIQSFFEWVHHTVGLFRAHKSDVFRAPKYTHSCNRFFHPCSLIPFCASARDDQQQMLNEMFDETIKMEEMAIADA